MRSDDLAGANFKRVCADFPNLMLLTKIATPGNIQVIFGHASVDKNSLWETVAAFFLAESLESPRVVSINSKRTFSSAGEKIHLPVAEVLLCAAASNLACLKNMRYLKSLNAVLLPPFLTEAIILEGDNSTTDLHKNFTSNIVECGLETAAESSDSKD